jgi:hypothetical protein
MIVWRAAVDEDGHYSFAVPLRCRSPPLAPIGKSATACDLALRLMGGCLPDFAGGSQVPSSMAAMPSPPGIDVMAQKQSFRRPDGRKLRFNAQTALQS